MNINEICYVCVSERDGNDIWLCYDADEDRPFIATKNSGYLPILFGSEDMATDTLLKYTNFKGWTIQEVRLANNA